MRHRYSGYLPGETVKAFVVLKPGESLTSEDVIEYCKQKLAKVQRFPPGRFIETLPKSGVGKILRKELRAMELKKWQGRLKTVRTIDKEKGVRLAHPLFSGLYSDGHDFAKRPVFYFPEIMVDLFPSAAIIDV